MTIDRGSLAMFRVTAPGKDALKYNASDVKFVMTVDGKKLVVYPCDHQTLVPMVTMLRELHEMLEAGCQKLLDDGTVQLDPEPEQEQC